MDTEISDSIIAAIKKIVDEIAPDARYVPKYGGEVIATVPGDDSKFVGGMFVNKAHVSLEFSNGAAFDDPKGLLGGKGKLRRHLKFETVEDVAAQDAEHFLKQALSGRI